MFYALSHLEGNALGHVQLYVPKDYSKVNIEDLTKIVVIQNLIYAEPNS